jgi:DNA-directed RNA polymerase subunit omega
MRDDYFKAALEIVDDPYVLVNMIWERMQMLRRGNRPLVESPEMLPLEDVALREIIEGRITYVLGSVVVPENLGTQERAGNTRSDSSTAPFVDAPCNAGAAT